MLRIRLRLRGGGILALPLRMHRIRIAGARRRVAVTPRRRVATSKGPWRLRAVTSCIARKAAAPWLIYVYIHSTCRACAQQGRDGASRYHVCSGDAAIRHRPVRRPVCPTHGATHPRRPCRAAIKSHTAGSALSLQRMGTALASRRHPAPARPARAPAVRVGLVTSVRGPRGAGINNRRSQRAHGRADPPGRCRASSLSCSICCRARCRPRDAACAELPADIVRSDFIQANA